MTRREWVIILFGVPICVVLSLLIGNVIATERQQVGRACYNRTFVHPFSRNQDTVDMQLCFHVDRGVTPPVPRDSGGPE